MLWRQRKSFLGTFILSSIKISLFMLAFDSWFIVPFSVSVMHFQDSWFEHLLPFQATLNLNLILTLVMPFFSACSLSGRIAGVHDLVRFSIVRNEHCCSVFCDDLIITPYLD